MLFTFGYVIVELAMIMGRLYGGVCYAGIDTDPELKYPKGAGRVAFSSQRSYIAAISARFVQLQHGDIDKRVRPSIRKDLWFMHFFCFKCDVTDRFVLVLWTNVLVSTILGHELLKTNSNL